MKNYQRAWLEAHPGRTEKWLRARLRDGFHIHHLDGDRGNNDPANLLLLEAQDHARLHSGQGVTVIGPVRRPRGVPRLAGLSDDEIHDEFLRRAGVR